MPQKWPTNALIISLVQIVNNVVIGVAMSPAAAYSTESSGATRVMQYAGIRTDEIPMRMIGNVVAGSHI